MTSPGGGTDLRLHTEHLQTGRHVQARLVDAHVAEVGVEVLAPDTEVVDVEDGEVARESDDHGLPVVPAQGSLRAVLVGHYLALRRRLRALADPEVRVCRERKESEFPFCFCYGFI